jgi:Xaa-Pro dipeptidase
MEASEVDTVRYIKDLNRMLCAHLKPGAILYVLNPNQIPKLDHHKGTLQIDTVQLRPAIERARVIKTDHEIALIRRANAISVRHLPSSYPSSLFLLFPP